MPNNKTYVDSAGLSRYDGKIKDFVDDSIVTAVTAISGGSQTKPVYMVDGVPTVCTYTATNGVRLDILGLNSSGEVHKVSSNGLYLAADNSLYCPAGVHDAVWNDLVDLIPVDEECELEFGKVYCFDGEHYYQSDKYMPEGLIGINSDTGGFIMGHKEGVKELQISVAGFVLAYVDKEYPVGTPLTAGPDGYLTEIKKEDKVYYPERILATFWKKEDAEIWGSDFKKVKVNGRKWVKVK